MAYDEHVAILKKGVEAWNAWRNESSKEVWRSEMGASVRVDVDPDLRKADLAGAYLSGANLSDANLSAADLSDADLIDADLSSIYLTVVPCIPY